MKSLKLSSYRTFSLFVWVLALTLLGQPVVPLAVTHGAGGATANEKPATTSAPDAATKARVEENYGKLPLSFEANKGQTDARVKFLSRGQGYSFFLTPSEAVITLNRAEAKEQGARAKKETSATLRMKLVGANEQPRISGLDEQAGKSNYFLGNDARQWKTDVPNYGKVKYEAVYPGVDVVYYGNQQQLEYDLIVAPGADPNQIKLSFAGAQQMRLDENGDLLLKTQAGEVRQHKPVVYQEVAGRRQEITSRYVINKKSKVYFEVGEYNHSKPLVIDPVVSYATFLTGIGGGGIGLGVATDTAGYAYVTGVANLSFPTTAGAVKPSLIPPNGQPATNAGNFAFVTKLTPDGSDLIYSALVGGITGVRVTGSNGSYLSLDTRGWAITVDAAGSAYVVGTALCKDFPTTPGAIVSTFDPTPIPASAPTKPLGFAFKLNITGSTLLYSTLLPYSYPRSVAVDSLGSACVTGDGFPGFPTTPGAFQPNSGRDVNYAYQTDDAIVAKLNSTGTKFIYSTFLGGGSSELGWDIAVDTEGSAYVTGLTYNDYIDQGVTTNPFPVTRAPFQQIVSQEHYIFASKFNATGALVYSVLVGTAVGDSINYGPDIVVDAAGQAYIAGITRSFGFPTTPGAFQRTFGTVSSGNSVNGFVTKLSADGNSLVYSTFFGGGGTAIYDIKLDAEGNAYLMGDNGSIGFPGTADNFQPSATGRFVAKLNAAGSKALSYVAFSTLSYPQSMGLDNRGNVYVTGGARYNFPTTPGAYQRTIERESIPNPPDIENFTHTFVMKFGGLASPRPVLNVSAASYNGAALSSDSIVAAFGTGLATGIQVATSATLPTNLAGTTVKVKDNAGTERDAPLFFVSPTQINYLIPPGTVSGAATITVISGDGVISSSPAQIAIVSPGLFTADASGRGAAAAVVLRVKANGTQSYEPVAQFDPAQNKVVPIPIDLGPEGDQVFLISYGTGIRYNSGLSGVSAKFGGTDAPVLFAGAQGDFFGLDQVNVRLPRSLAGRGDVDVVMTADGKTANTVQVRIK